MHAHVCTIAHGLRDAEGLATPGFRRGRSAAKPKAARTKVDHNT